MSSCTESSGDNLDDRKYLLERHYKRYFQLGICCSLPQKIDTSNTNITLHNLEPEVTYELVVKSGNPQGTSILSAPITFVTADKYIVKSNANYGN